MRKTLLMTSTAALAERGVEIIGSAKAAEILGVDQSTLNRWAKSGRLPHLMKLDGRTGGRLYDRAAVEAEAAARGAAPDS